MNWFELLSLIAIYGVIGWILLVFGATLFGGRSRLQFAVGVLVGGYLIRVLLIVINQEFHFFEDKLAGELSIGLYQRYVLDGHGWLPLLKEQFAAQVLLNIPAWMLFGTSLESILMSNAMLGALAAPLAAVLLFRDFGESAFKRALFLLSLYPGGLNFSLFGLRDPIIYVAMIIMVVGGMRIWMSGYRMPNLVLAGFGAFMTLWSRPELIYIVFVFCLIPVMNAYLNVLLNALSSRKAMSSLLLLTLPVIAVGAIAVLIATNVAARNIGERTFNPADIADGAAVSRFERHDEAFGGGSHIISASLYSRLPWYLRVPLQTSGLLLLPFPWKVTSVSRLLAFGDSMFLISLLMFSLINLYYAKPFRQVGIGRLIFFLLLVCFVGFVGLGFVVSNFGNGFRMRLAVTPLIFLSTAVCPIRVRFRMFGSRRTMPLAQSC